jgi:hypothetical protein
VIRPHLTFVGTLLLAPVLAIIAVTSGDPWMWPGVAASAGLVATAAARSLLALRDENGGWRPRIPGMRMMAVTASVTVAASLLVVFSLVMAIIG